MTMKKITQIILYAWSAIMLLTGLNHWFSTIGFVMSNQFSMQIAMVGSLGMIMVWLALFGVWFTLPPRRKESGE